MGHEDLAGESDLYWKGETLVHSAEEMLAVIQQNQRCVWIDPQVNEVKPFVKSLLEWQRAQPTKNPVTIFFDEAHLLMPQGSINLAASVRDGEEPDTYTLFFTNGRRWNLQGVLISQRPQLLDATCYKVSPNKFFFRLDAADEQYFHRMGVSIKERTGYAFDLRVS